MDNTHFTPVTTAPVEGVPASIEDRDWDEERGYPDHIDHEQELENWFNNIASYMHNVSGLETSSVSEVTALLVADGHTDFTLRCGSRYSYDADAGGFIVWCSFLERSDWATSHDMFRAYEHFYIIGE
jgi:hypothetical protein